MPPRNALLAPAAWALTAVPIPDLAQYAVIGGSNRHGNGWADLGPSGASTSGPEQVAIGFWRNLGEDLEIETPERHHRPKQTNALACIFGEVSKSAIFRGLIRDEEVAGSNPVTPTR
jgi:hypothetical protein